MTMEFLEKLIFTYGPMAGILLYLLYRDHTDRKDARREREADRRRIEDLERKQTEVLIPLLAEHNKTLVENTTMFRELARLLKAIASEAPTATHKALDKIHDVVERRIRDSSGSRQPVAKDDESNYGVKA